MSKTVPAFEILLFLFLTGCQSINQTTAVDITPSSDNSQKQTKVSILTETPSPTGIPSLPPTLKIIEFPGWLKNPETNVLAYRKQDKNGISPLAISFLNPETSEQFEIETSDYSYFYWHDSQTLILTQGTCDNPEYIIIVDTTSGLTTRYSYQESPIKDTECLFENIPERYTTETRWDDNFEGYAIYIDTQTGKEKVFTNLGDGIYDGRAIISPNNKYIVILQSENPDLLEGPVPAIAERIEIYTISNGKLVMTIKEEIGMRFDMFYPDSDEKFIVLRDETPCIIEIDIRQKKCIYNITNKFPEASIYLGYFTADQKKLIFMYALQNSGGLCFYDLFSGNISCPTDGLSLLENLYVISYQRSPDEKYILLLYGTTTPLSDAGGPSGRAIIGTNGGNFTDLGFGADFIWTWTQAQWRPTQ